MTLVSAVLDKQVFKTGVTHYFSIAAAKRDFGYDPEPRDLSGVVQWFRDRGHGKKRSQEGWCTWLMKSLLAVVVVILIWSLLMSLLPLVH